MSPESPDAIIRRVLGRHLDAERDASRRGGSTRCVLVVDATTDSLAAALTDANFQVVRAGAGLADHEARRQHPVVSSCSHRA